MKREENKPELQRVVICTLAWGGWYPRGVARMVEQFHQHSPGFEIQAWVNVLPPWTIGSMREKGYDYTAYGAKPWVLEHARESGADIAILLDAAFYPIRPIHPLIEHIAQNGYYLCRNGNNVGEWSSDRCLQELAMSRHDAFKVEEISSYCVGLNFARDHSVCTDLLAEWCGWSTPGTIVGHHTNTNYTGRNVGLISTDPRVRGHRHDQTVLSILAHRLGMKKLSNRPQFTSYLGSETDETVLVNQGMG